MLVWLFLLFIPVVNSPTHCSLTIFVSGLSNNEGQVCIALFNTEDSYRRDGEAFRIAQIIPAGRSAEITWNDLPAGTYAVSIFHDENKNGKLDFNLMGIPTERYGFSNNAKGFFGKPAFKEVSFILGDAPVTLSIEAGGILF